MKENLNNLICLLPSSPGVYLMKDINGEIIYIGKAKDLKKRVSQYFLRPQVGKVLAMVSRVESFDFIVVSTDKEAFILEMNLIQKHHPRYNIVMMDDSHYPYIALRKKDAKLSLSRNTLSKDSLHFGPFPNAGAAKQTLQILNTLYPTRKCNKLPSKPCLYHHLNQCLSPCINKISEETYSLLYERIKRFMEGDVKEAIAKLKEKMDKASEELRFEDAKEYKRMIDSILLTISKQQVESSKSKIDRDVIGFVERESYRAISILTYRNGLLLGKENFVFASFNEVDEQVLELLGTYYSCNSLPKEIVLGINNVGEALKEIYPSLNIIHPKEGNLLNQIEIATSNARNGLDAHFMSARLEEDEEEMLESLGNLLNISTPKRIELFDNSHLQGHEAVSALVCFINGKPAKKMYRKYILGEANSGDDYHSMIEVSYRRFSRLKENNLSYPDLLLVDGGLNQVKAVLEGLNKAGVNVPVFGLYKNDKHQTEGIIDENGVKYPLDRKSPLFFLLMRMQDEVHRFAISFHKERRSKHMKNSVFDNIKGVGEKRKEILRKHYPTIEDFKKVSKEELSQLFPKEVVLELIKLKEKL